LRGPGFDVPETGQLENGETIADYLERNPEAAGAMSLLISENCSRPIPLSKESPRLRRFNLALLPPIDFTITVPAAEHQSSQSNQENANEPHSTARSLGIPSNDGDK
jgi:hypothetical protein